jgi:hypothetical protein
VSVGSEVDAELISSTLKMEAICSSETPVDTQRTTRRYIPEVDAVRPVSDYSDVSREHI